MEGYAFPVMDLVPDPLKCKDVRSTDFPSLTTLSCAFDPSIVAKVYKCIGAEAKAEVPNAYYDINNRPEDREAVRDPFLLAKRAAYEAAGLNAAGMPVNYNDMAQFDDTVEEHIDGKLFTDILMRCADPDSVIVRTPNETDRYAEYRGGGLMYGFAQTKEEVARFLQAGYSFVYLASDFTEELIPYLCGLAAEYKKAEEACLRGKITREKMDMCCRELVMLSEDRINEACDAVIERLIFLSNNNRGAVFERSVALGKEEAHFDEPQHASVALEAARGSIVLIKNDGVLPLEHEQKAAVLGEYAKDKSYHAWGNKSTAPYLPFEVINDFDIQTVGFAYGYRAGEPLRTDLWNTARRLCNKADVTIVYLCARAGEYTLPTEQLELLQALHDNNTKTVAVVASDGVIDMEFAELCNAVLLTHRGGQKVAHAVFEVLTGFSVPAGKLPYAVPMHIEASGETSGAVRYPLGYGLGYTTFSYDTLNITDAGVSLTVRNKGERDGYATVLLHVQKKATDDKPAGERRLRGFAKVFVPAHGSEKIHIPFGEETFRSYNFSKGLYCVEGGAYCITVGETETDTSLTGEITVRAYTFKDEHHLSTEAARGKDGAALTQKFADLADRRAYFMRNHTAKAGVRIFLAILLALYFDAAATLLFVGELLPDVTICYILIGVALAFVNVWAIVYSVTAVKRHRKLQTENVPITDDTVAKLGNFTELATVSYEKPIASEVAEEEEAAEQEEAQEEPVEQEEQLPEYTYDTGFTEGVRQNIAFKNDVSFPEICRNFHDYVLGWGIDVAPSSIRALFSAIAASKIVFVQVNHKDILPNFLVALGSYFQGADVVDVSPDWKTPSDLFWTLSDNKYVASGFVNSVYAAQRTPDKNAVSILNHVQTEGLRDWFGDIIRFALFPSEKHVLKLNDATQVELPHNLCYLLFTDDDGGELPPDIAAASVQIHIGMGPAEVPGEPVEVKPVSLRAFDDLVKEAREEYFLPEGIWKKLDELCETISAKERFGLGNKVVLQMEKFSSVLLACGADAGETFTKTFTAKVVAMLKTLAMYKEDKGDKTVYGYIEKLYGDENLTKIRKALIKATAQNKGKSAKAEKTTEDM